MFEDIITGSKKVTKAADAAEFEFVDGVLVRKDPMFALDSPKPSTTEPGIPTPAAARFNSDAAIVGRKASGVPMVMPLADYLYEEPTDADLTAAGTMPSEIFLTPGEGEQIPVEGFKPPAPAQRPQGAGPVRLGSGYVLKSEFDEGEGN